MWCRRAFALVLVFVLAGCATTADDVAPESSVTSTTVSSITTSSTVEASTTTTVGASTSTTSTTTVPEVLPDLVFDDRGVAVNGQTSGVLVTDTGWVVPILSGLEGGRHRVWTPCGRQADIGGGQVIASADIVLDPGHGGSEPGAVGQGGLREADLNLDVSLELRDLLVGAGYSVVMTRESDVRVPITTRAEIARALDPIAFLSIHFNAGTDAPSETPGTEMYHQIDNPASKRLAGLIYEESRAALGRYDIEWVALSDAGAMVRPDEAGDDYYGVLRRPGPVPSVLTEYAYLSNPAEEALVSDPLVQRELAEATLSAIERFVTTDDPGSGFTDDPIFRGFGPSGAGGTANCADPELE